MDGTNAMAVNASPLCTSEVVASSSGLDSSCGAGERGSPVLTELVHDISCWQGGLKRTQTHAVFLGM